MQAQGHNGQVVFDGQFVTITRKGFLARSSVGKGEKRIALRSINAVQFKPAGAVVNGFIEFTVGGGNERQSKFGRQTTDAVSNENAVVFTRKQMPVFEELRRAIEEHLAALGAPQATAAAPPNVAQQIIDLAQLRDQGLLTDAEFQTKKAELLARM